MTVRAVGNSFLFSVVYEFEIIACLIERNGIVIRFKIDTHMA